MIWHQFGLVLSGALWQVADTSTAIGQDVDQAVYRAVSHYMTPEMTMLGARWAVVRGAQDMAQAGESQTIIVPHIEQVLYAREVGPPPVWLYNATADSCGWWFELDPGATMRYYSVTFWEGTGQNSDQSMQNAGFSIQRGIARLAVRGPGVPSALSGRFLRSHAERWTLSRPQSALRGRPAHS